MAVEDFLEGEVAIAVAATAALSSSRVRKVLRRGVVYGLAGVLLAGDALASTAREVKGGAGQRGVPDPHTAADAAVGAQMGMGDGNSTLPGLLRGGAVSGLAKVMTAGEALSSAARGAARNIQQTTATVAQEAAAQAKAGGSGSGTSPSQPATQGEAGAHTEGGVPAVGAGPDA